MESGLYVVVYIFANFQRIRTNNYSIEAFTLLAQSISI